MDFAPVIHDPAPMDERIFDPAPMGLKESLLGMHLYDRFSYNPETNTKFINFAGLRMRTEEDVAAIREAVESRLKAIGKQVISVAQEAGQGAGGKAAALTHHLRDRRRGTQQPASIGVAGQREIGRPIGEQLREL